MLQKPAVHLVCVTLIAMAFAGCEAEKSRNPLSPTIAGPIAGVEITAPKGLEPINNSRLHASQQPLQLLFENSSSNSERPFWHVIELATDSGFSNKVYTSDKLSPGSNGRTAHRLPALDTGRVYFWRVKAEDGANSSGFSDLRSFEVLVPVVINAPTPLSPVSNQTTSSTAVQFVMTNGSVSASAGNVVYRVEVASDQGFGSIVAAGQVPRSGGSTTSLPLNLPPGTQLFWRALGFDNQAASGWSSAAAFRTPGTLGGGGGGGGGGGAWVPPPPPSGQPGARPIPPRGSGSRCRTCPRSSSTSPASTRRAPQLLPVARRDLGVHGPRRGSPAPVRHALGLQLEARRRRRPLTRRGRLQLGIAGR
jgi:hypothetical protein